MKVFVDLTGFAASATRAHLRDRVAQLEGATGVSVSDHIFFTCCCASSPSSRCCWAGDG